MNILDRNAKCPLCGKYYHRWDIHRNAIPDRLHQRTEQSLCQCAKGQDARQFRKMKRLELEAEQLVKKTRREEWNSRDERNNAYWAGVQSKKQLRGGEIR